MKLLWLAGGLVAGFGGGLVLTGRIATSQPAAAGLLLDQAKPAAAAPAASGVPTGGLPDLSPVAERAIQASVNISSTQFVQTNPWFQMMGGDRLIQESSLGSGVIVSDDGYVLTNSHVAGDRDADIKVTLPDNREMPAKVVGIDPLSDMAVLKINAKGLTTLPWGDSSKLRVAEWVLAVGNPFAFSQTVTLGIVSNKNRHDPQLAVYNDFIQTDAAINPGNSGGALVNARGELIGINTMIYSQTGGYQGIGFAIPSNLARTIMTELRERGEIRRGSIGLAPDYLMKVTPELNREYSLGSDRGVVIRRLSTTSSAWRAGLRSVDVIVGIDGVRVDEPGDLQRAIAEAKIGGTVKISYIRQGRPQSVDVPVQQMTAREIGR